ncbi:regulatory protein RecX [Sphingomonas sp. ASY06-1R]|uniref:regulatory protein RecX n=1 Tax=Sphingomonas sp. ASY06-1R TaxID=3445771 RepID=UPI003FA1F08D
MSRRNYTSGPRTPKPFDADALNQLALAYLGRYATTRAKLRYYLVRKLASRGWEGEAEPPIDAIVERCAELGYVDDAGFAVARGAALTRRGFGEQRVAAALRAVGIDADTAAPVRETARAEALDAALRFARRKRIGPFAQEVADPDQRRRNLAALMRAGHSLDLARRIVSASPGAFLTDDE